MKTVGTWRSVAACSLAPQPYHIVVAGKAPPVDPCSAESEDERWDDWLLSFERAGEWNGWTDAERLLQLAGHLRGKVR